MAFPNWLCWIWATSPVACWKYLRRNPVPRVTIAGGFGKLTKLAQGFLDLHSGRSQVDFTWLADRLAELEAPADLVEEAKGANTANQVLTRAVAAGVPLADLVAARARAVAIGVLGDCGTDVEVLVFDRKGGLEGRAGFAGGDARVLILGGTADAAALARGLSGVGVITSLAGRTKAPAALPGEVRVGGFGGAEGLAAYLEERGYGCCGCDSSLCRDDVPPCRGRVPAAADAPADAGACGLDPAAGRPMDRGR